MQIFEFTKHQQLNEAGLIDTLKKTMQSVRTPKAGTPMQGMSWSERFQALSNNQDVKNLAKVAWTNWNQRNVQLMQANQGMPVDEAEYRRQLTSFVDRLLLQGGYKYLEPNSRSKVDAAMEEVVKARANPKSLAIPFQNLTRATTTSLQDSNASRVNIPGQPGAGQQQQQQQASPAQQAIRAAVTKIQGADLNALASALRSQAPQGVQRTNNEAVDELLTLLKVPLR